MNNKIIGIIGGMGPEATANLYLKIIRATHVEKDQDHYRVIIDGNSKIPDRTAAILSQGESPISGMIEAGKNLEKLGVDLALIPCITAHYFINEVQKQLSIPILNALEELNNYIKSYYPSIKKIGILATSGTIKSKLFNRYIQDIEIIIPHTASQEEKVMKAIYGERGIKAGNIEGEPLELLIMASNELIEKGAELIIAGCTEVGLVLKPHHIPKPLIDPMDVAVEIALKGQI
ncbi:MAG TPA: aspartate/glutamate racemase family protein [Eubacteriaceae bacterium]|jgi:aspartate racemase|nr:aspartate/glutamate racemase family protein [Eubacteriaceae bacterium]